jgi:RHS repeat-associated protein
MTNLVRNTQFVLSLKELKTSHAKQSSVSFSCFRWQGIGSYRYGFNGKEKENECFEGAYDFGARILDARLGKWLSVDAFVKDFPMLSPYQFAANSPIFLIDPDGNTIIPTGQGTNHTPEISKAMLEGYFRTAFGSEMAAAFVSSYAYDGFGDFRGNSAQKDEFVKSFNAALSQMNNDYLKTLAIGVFESICSNEPTYFIGYAGGADSGTCPGDDNVGTCYRKTIMTENGNFLTCEPTVNGNPSLCSLTNGVDALYAGKSGPSGNSLATSALVAVSDGGYVNIGAPSAPNMGYVSNPNMVGPPAPDPQYGMSINVIEQIAATGRCLSKDLVKIGSQSIVGEDGQLWNRQANAAGTEHDFFNSVANNLRAMLQGQPAQMNRNQRRAMQDSDKGGASYAPDSRD